MRETKDWNFSVDKYFSSNIFSGNFSSLLYVKYPRV